MSPTRTIQRAAGVIALGAMIATPLNRRGGRARRVLSSVVVGALAGTTGAGASNRWGVRRAVAAGGAVAGVTGVIERVGTSTGFPFGRYEYTGVLRPQVAGVPVIVPLAWFAMAVPARESAHAALGALGIRSTRVRRIVAGAAALTAWDLFLDPQMVGEGYWGWARRGVYRGIPLTNYLGWFLTGLGVMAILEVALPPGDPPSGAAPDQVGVYATMAAMETLGHARFFRDPLVAVVGGTGMLPSAALATVAVTRARTDPHGSGS